MNQVDPSDGHFLSGYGVETALQDADFILFADNSASNRLKTITMANLFAYVEGNITRPQNLSWNVTDEIKVPAGDADNLMPVPLTIPSGWNLTLGSCAYIIRSGTSVTLKVKQKTSGAGVYTDVQTGISATTTHGTTSFSTNNVLSGGNIYYVGIEVTAVSSTPRDLAFSIFGTWAKRREWNSTSSAMPPWLLQWSIPS